MAAKKATPADQENEHRRLDAYVRVSDTKGRSGESFISPKEQQERIEAWLKSQGHTLATYSTDTPRPDPDWPQDGEPAIWKELDESGGKTDRPMLNEVMRRIETGETEGVVVSYLSRFGRTLVGTLELVKRIDEAGGLFASVAEGFDITTPHGRLVLNMMLSIAQFELERTTAQWDTAIKKAVGRGLHVSGNIPFGYRWRDGLTGSSDPAWNSDYSATLEPDPERSEIVKELFDRRASGESITVLKRWLEKAAPERVWTNTAILRTLRRPTYLGRAFHGEFSNDEAHVALVDRETWEAAQGTRTPRKMGAGRADALLHGLVRCASCRYAMIIVKPSSTRAPHAYYKCATDDCIGRSQITITGPGSGRWRKEQDKINDHGLDDYVVRQAFERYPTVEDEEHTKDAELDRARAAVELAEKDLAGYDDPKTQRAAGIERFLAGLAQRRAIVEAAKAELKELRRIKGKRRPKNITTLEADWDGMTIDARRVALSQVIQAVFVRPAVRHPRKLSSMSPKQRLTAERGTGNGASAQRIHVVWVEEPIEDVPRQGRRGYVRRPFTFPGSN